MRLGANKEGDSITSSPHGEGVVAAPESLLGGTRRKKLRERVRRAFEDSYLVVCRIDKVTLSKGACILFLGLPQQNTTNQVA